MASHGAPFLTEPTNFIPNDRVPFGRLTASGASHDGLMVTIGTIFRRRTAYLTRASNGCLSTLNDARGFPAIWVSPASSPIGCRRNPPSFRAHRNLHRIPLRASHGLRPLV